MTQKNYLGETIKADVRKKKTDNAFKRGLAGMFSKKPPSEEVAIVPDDFDEL